MESIGSYLPVNTKGSSSIQILQYKAYCDIHLRFRIAKAIEISSMKNILSILKSYSYSGGDLNEQIAKISSLIDATCLLQAG